MTTSEERLLLYQTSNFKFEHFSIMGSFVIRILAFELYFLQDLLSIRHSIQTSKASRPP